MTENNIHLKLNEEGKTELVVYEARGLDMRDPKPLQLKGKHITAPGIYLGKRKPKVEDVLVLKDIRKKTITVYSAAVPGEGEAGSLQSEVEGKLVVNPDLEAFKINTEKARFNISDMKAHVKKNKRFFQSQTQYDKILSGLDDFNGKVVANVKAKQDRQGNASTSYVKEVTMDFDPHFDIRIPLFDGFDPANISVELCYDMTSSGSVEFYLMSDTLPDQIDAEAESIIEAEIEKIKELNYLILY